MSRVNYSAEQFIQSIPGSGGIITSIARKVGCTWNTAKKYIDTHPTVHQAYIDEQESMLDMAEGTLFKSIKDGDTQDAKWLLSRRGKHRGYGDALDLNNKGELNIVLRWQDGNNDAPAP